MGTGLAGRIEGIHLQHIRPIQNCLVLQLPKEFRPAYIRDCLGKTMIFHHILDVQVLNGNGLILPDQCRRCFVQEISSDIRNPFMHTGDTDAGFGSVRRFRHFPGKPPLFTGKLPGQMAQNPWVVYGVSVAVGVELLQSYIYANHTSGIPTQQGIHAHFHAKGDIVFPRCGTGYGGIQNLAAKTSGKLGFHFPNFRKLDFVSNDTDSFGLVPRAVGLATDMLGFETGIVRPFLEEILDAFLRS